MPTATKRDATSLRAVPKSDRLAEAALLGSDGSAAPQAGPGTQTSVQQPSAPATPPAQVPAPPSLGHFMAPLGLSGYLGTRQEIQDELDAIAFSVRSFPLKQPDQILREASAYTARLTELVVLLHRHEDYDRQYARVRTMQVQKWIEELERQWKTASRLIEVARQDIALVGGMT